MASHRSADITKHLNSAFLILHSELDLPGCRTRYDSPVNDLDRHGAVFFVIGSGVGLQLLSLMAVIPFVYHAFSLTGASYGQLTTLGIMLYTSAAYTPLPGASGAQEGVFALYFAQIIPDGIRVMALLLWRFFTYSLSLIVGAVVTVPSS